MFLIILDKFGGGGPQGSVFFYSTHMYRIQPILKKAGLSVGNIADAKDLIKL